jgi:hypothetical protein
VIAWELNLVSVHLRASFNNKQCRRRRRPAPLTGGVAVMGITMFFLTLPAGNEYARDMSLSLAVARHLHWPMFKFLVQALSLPRLKDM